MSDNAVAKTNTAIQPIDYRAKAQTYLSFVGNNLPQSSVVSFLELCHDLQLNPFKREVYAVPYEDYKTHQVTLSIITGYEVYLKRADRIAKMNGWHCEESGRIEDNSYSVTLVINRKDWAYPFKHTVYFSEVCQRKKDGSLTQFWQKQPRFMTKKVAIAQGFRLCFPDEMGGMPYTRDELPQGEVSTKTVNDGHGNEYEIIENSAEISQPQNPDELRELRERINAISAERILTTEECRRIAVRFNDKNTPKEVLLGIISYLMGRPLKSAKTSC